MFSAKGLRRLVGDMLILIPLVVASVLLPQVWVPLAVGLAWGLSGGRSFRHGMRDEEEIIEEVLTEAYGDWRMLLAQAGNYRKRFREDLDMNWADELSRSYVILKNQQEAPWN